MTYCRDFGNRDVCANVGSTPDRFFVAAAHEFQQSGTQNPDLQKRTNWQMASNAIESSKKAEAEKGSEDPYMLGRDYVASGRYVDNLSQNSCKGKKKTVWAHGGEHTHQAGNATPPDPRPIRLSPAPVHHAISLRGGQNGGFADRRCGDGDRVSRFPSSSPYYSDLYPKFGYVRC